ncbi:MAG: hypothetical protein IT443_01440 [Phycisphaeraceae bacterium]|nr:hypothetical protein [Phycisphaeraceae bacterium]
MTVEVPHPHTPPGSAPGNAVGSAPGSAGGYAPGSAPAPGNPGTPGRGSLLASRVVPDADTPVTPGTPGSPVSGLPQPAAARPAADRLEDLTDIIRAYNQVTENLQRSHEALRQEVTRLQTELASSNAQLQRSKRLAALGEMAAGIAHEIRNPLGAIQLYAGLLISDLPASNASGQTARQIASAVRSLNAIVGDVLAFARELTPQPRRVLVEDVFNRAIQAHHPAIEAAGVVVEQIIADAGQPLEMLADADLLHQALLNLIRNAVDAMADRGGRLTLQALREGTSIGLVVRDTGPGIAQEHIDRIFNPFFTTRSTGTGLGLAIVHRIVDAHGGTITVHNQDGAVFELNLPDQPALEFATQDSTAGMSVTLTCPSPSLAGSLA